MEAGASARAFWPSARRIPALGLRRGGGGYPATRLGGEEGVVVGEEEEGRAVQLQGEVVARWVREPGTGRQAERKREEEK